MRVVVVMPEAPYPEGGPAGRCAAALLKGLAADSRIELTAVAARMTSAPVREPPPPVPVDIVPVPPQDRGQAWADLLRRPLGYLSRGEFGAHVRELAAGADVIHLDQVHTAWCDLGTDVTSLVHLHYLIRLDRPGLPSGLRAAAQLFALSAAEGAAMRRHEFLVANSECVANELRRRAPDADVTVVPLVLDPDQYEPSPGASQVAGFLGQARWPTTASAARRLLERVWPLVRREVPHARLIVAGRGMDELGLHAPDGAQIVGEVESASSFLGRLSLLLFPSPRGSGMKVKVLEALACGLPVVTSQVGAEGITPTEGIVVADDDEAIARAAVSILRDDGERRQRGAAALRTFEEHHTPEVGAAAFADLYARMTKSRS